MDWVSVDEGLPQDEEVVLVWQLHTPSKSGKCKLARRGNGSWFENPTYRELTDHPDTWRITHWMKIEPPEGR